MHLESATISPVVAAALLTLAAPLCVCAATCESLKGLSLPNTTIAESGTVAAASFKDVSVPWAMEEQLPERCQVKGTIRPTPDSQIAFEMWLPVSNWNGKLQGAGNGGFAGAINYESGLVQSLQRGY